MFLTLRQIYLFLSLFISFSALAVEPLQVKIGYIGLPEESSILGAKSGIEEANIQGQFLGQHYHLEQVSLTHDLSDFSALLVSADEQQWQELIQLNAAIPLFNLTDERDQLRLECIPSLFHIIPSQKMRSDAVAQWYKKHPDQTVHAAAWHYGFKKYAASQVNKRFQDLHTKPMDDQAYAGWMAIKLISDAVARTQSNQADQISHFLKTDLAIDGAKGLQMNFRSNGQLRQMMLLLADDKVVGEAPVRGVVKTTDLDSLGNLKCSNADQQ